MRDSYKTFIERYGQYIDRMPTYSIPSSWNYNDNKYNISSLFTKDAYRSLVKQQIDTKPTVASEEDILDMLGVDKAHG